MRPPSNAKMPIDNCCFLKSFLKKKRVSQKIARIPSPTKYANWYIWLVYSRKEWCLHQWGEDGAWSSDFFLLIFGESELQVYKFWATAQFWLFGSDGSGCLHYRLRCCLGSTFAWDMSQPSAVGAIYSLHLLAVYVVEQLFLPSTKIARLVANVIALPTTRHITTLLLLDSPFGVPRL